MWRMDVPALQLLRPSGTQHPGGRGPSVPIGFAGSVTGVRPQTWRDGHMDYFQAHQRGLASFQWYPVFDDGKG